jgi:uncharacterized membrane protein YccF (DUF307 family)
MNPILNILWLIMGGLIAGLAWYIAGVILILSIIGIPFARACFMLGNFSFFPFGNEVVARDAFYGREDIGTGFLGVIGNIVWFVLCGWWLALFHALAATLCAITIIGIPFAWQHLKLAGASLLPIGKTVVPRQALR